MGAPNKGTSNRPPPEGESPKAIAPTHLQPKRREGSRKLCHELRSQRLHGCNVDNFQLFALQHAVLNALSNLTCACVHA
eukprot:scaffold280945_cov32-Tisochrysis_lutea.AAC.4